MHIATYMHSQIHIHIYIYIYIHTQGPLRLSASYEQCGDDDDAFKLAPSMSQVLTLPPDKVRLGRLYIGVHAVDGNTARFMLSVSYRYVWFCVCICIFEHVCGRCTCLCVYIRVRMHLYTYIYIYIHVRLRKKAQFTL
jgi:hypothetical protein